MSKFFVYVSGLRGPEAQIWDDLGKTQEGKPIQTLFEQWLTPLEEDLGLDELKRRYPYEE